MTVWPEPLKRGYPVDENAQRFANYFHLLRELLHLSCGWLALVPAFETKYALGEHVHQDAKSLLKVKRRLYELRHPRDDPGAPGEELAAMLDRLERADSPEEYLALAYGGAKPTLLAALRIHCETLDDVTDEPSLGILNQLAYRQSRHMGAFGIVPTQDVWVEDLGSLPVHWRERRELPVMPPLDEPARDSFVEVLREGDPFLARELYVNGDENHVPTEPEEQRHFFHGLMDAELSAAELMARNSHEYPDMPLDFHVDMARQTWDELRHARVHDILMSTELGCEWGDYPVGFSYFKSVYAYDLVGRLALFNGTSEQKAMWRHSHRRKVLMELGQEVIAKVFDYLLADEVPHVHNGARWGAYLLGGDEKAYRDKVQELRAGLDETGQPIPTPST
jgi:hypothetical protein